MPEAASLEELLKAGAHFGHLTRRWNPKMQEFIFMQRNGIHIIDLNKTQKHLQDSLDAVSRVARSGKKVLFVGTKKQAQEIVKTEALRCGMPYVTNRWLGGMLTNFSTVRKSIARMEEIDNMQKDGTYESITKKERLMLDREKAKLEKVLAGIANMPRLPGAIFVVDTVKENIAMNEAIKLNIPIFALVDTNCDPDIPDYIIPCNDDASRTIQLITSNFADAIIEGAAEREAYEEEQLVQEAVTEIDSDANKEKAKDLAKEMNVDDDEDEEKKPKRKRRRKTSSKKKSKEDEE
jgi:small subunit ribosomal protein S2